MPRTFSGQRLREHRKARCLKRRELAARIGRSIHTVDAYETGHRVPSMPVLGALADALGVDVDAFFASGGQRP